MEKAKKNPLLVKNLLCKEFNIRETSSEAWLTFEQANNTETFDIEDLKPRYGVGGVDLSSTTDLTAAKVLFKIPENEKIYVLSMYWMPEDLVEKGSQRTRSPTTYGLKRICKNVQREQDIVQRCQSLVCRDSRKTRYLHKHDRLRFMERDLLRRRYAGIFWKTAMIPIIQGKRHYHSR